MKDEATALQRLDKANLLRTDGYINGQWVGGDRFFEVVNPATGQKIAAVADLGAKETEQAMRAANQAWPGWRDTTVKQRHSVMIEWFRLLLQHSEELALIITLEEGKPLREARGEVSYGASFIEWFAEEAKRIKGETIPAYNSNDRITVIRQAIGVCAAITPWNFPLAMITRKIAPALAAGCTVVVKPSELTPLTALAVAELAARAGFPDGVINVVTGTDAESIGKVLCESDVVRHLSFTGSTAVGRKLMRQCADTIKKLSLELGGNAPFVVFDDADLDLAVAGLVASKFRNAGQTCVCANRIFVQSGVYDLFIEKLTAKVRTMKVGSGFNEDTDIGPLIEDSAASKVENQVRDAQKKGGVVAVGGKRIEGRFFQPTVITEANEEMLFAGEEIFGPVAPIYRFDSEQQLVRMANNTIYGLASYFYSRDAARITRVAESLEYGMVGINTGSISFEHVPFGGVKQSGLGREGSSHGIDEYLEMKYLCMSGIGSLE